MKFSADNPILTFESLQFYTFHERTTHRRILQILDPKNNEEQCELAIDLARFKFNDKILIHYEIELEEKTRIGHYIIQTCAKELKKLFSTLSSDEKRHAQIIEKQYHIHTGQMGWEA